MGIKISEYPVELVEFRDEDLLDVSAQISNDPITWQSQKVKWSTVKAQARDAIYYNNGTLTGNRTVLQSGNYLSFQGGAIGMGTVPDSNTRNHVKGVDSTLLNYTVKFQNSNGDNNFLLRNDGRVTFGDNNVFIGVVRVSILQGSLAYGLYINESNTGNGGLLFSGKETSVRIASNQGVPFHLMMNITEAISMVGTSVGIYNATPDASAVLDIVSTTKGLAPPRMTGAQAESISSPIESLLVYATLGNGAIITTKGWWGWSGATWEKLN